jgi:hypothetical protein
MRNKAVIITTIQSSVKVHQAATFYTPSPYSVEAQQGYHVVIRLENPRHAKYEYGILPKSSCFVCEAEIVYHGHLVIHCI